MKYFRCFVIFFLMFLYEFAYAESITDEKISIERVSDSEILIKNWDLSIVA